MKKYKLELAIIMFSISMIVFCFFSVKNRVENQIWKLKSALLEKQFAIAELKDIRNYSLNSESLILADTIKQCCPDNICVLRLHDGICLSCYAENLIQLEKKIYQYEDVQLFVLGSYNFLTQLKEELASVNLNNVMFVNMPKYNILPADSVDKPYLFFLNKKGVVSNFYFFQKEEYTSIDLYLRNIRRIKLNR